jgi:hypothetical protein
MRLLFASGLLLKGYFMARWLLIIAAAFMAGCGGGDEALQVTGVVKNADGSPIPCESGTVLFQPTASGENATGQHASGAVNPDGTFSMMTKVPGDGVKPGPYKVVLQLWKSYRDGKLAVPKEYGDASTTPLEATVDRDHTHFEFKVEP